MSKKLSPEVRAKAAGPLSKVQQEFIAIHLARGATPKTIREVMNNLSTKTRDQLRFDYRMPTHRAADQRGRTWAVLAGTRQITQADVRRVYDALRKTSRALDASRLKRIVTAWAAVFAALAVAFSHR